ncbi:MAG: FCD domain-containing protein [Xylophilus ampelinus]
MPLQTIEPRRLYRQIADQIRALVEAGEFAVGARLPPERDLALQLGVSRPSVREALIALEIEGLVEVRMGSGIYVLPPRAGAAQDAGVASGAIGEGPLEIIRARQSIEAGLAAQAALAMDRRQLDGLRGSLVLMRQEAAAGKVPADGDRMLHLAIAAASDNSVLLRIVTELFDERGSPLFAQLSSYFESPGSWRYAIAEHEAVVDAIAAGDAGAARDAMHRHLGNSYERFNASWSQAARQRPGAAAAPSSEASRAPRRRRAAPASGGPSRHPSA